MARLILTAEEKQSSTYLQWSDAALGRAVKKLAADIRDHHGGEAIALTACASMLACSVAQRGALRTEIKLEGVHQGAEELGDWKITIARNSTVR